MTTLRWPVRRRVLTVAALALAAAADLGGAPPASPPRRIAIFGSSVASGTGDESGREGYAGLLRALLLPRGWEIVNQSRPGDDTAALMSRFASDESGQPGTRYLMSAHPGYVVVALSLGNEGIRGAEGAAAKDVVAERFVRGVRTLVDRSRAEGMVPIVTLCYTRNDFTDVEYVHTRRVNGLLNGWDVPSVNLLGAVDDGTGKWARGFWWDSLHPNAAGHAEMATTFVPSLFDALERGIARPVRQDAGGYAQLSGGAALSFSPDAPMHPFTLGFTVRSTGDGVVARIGGRRLEAATSTKTITRSGSAPQTIESTTLTAGPTATAAVSIHNGVWTYVSTDGVTSASSVPADGRWHQVLVSHYAARGESLFFVDGVLAGKTAERLAPEAFVVGSSAAGRRMDVKDVLIYRAALNADEAAALHDGALLQASLEVYAPLSDRQVLKGRAVQNRAQSLSALTLEAGRLTHVSR